MWFDSLGVYGGVYVFIGEDHYIGSDKQTLASTLRLFARKREIELYVEAPVSWIAEAEDQLAQLAGVPTYRRSSDNDHSILSQFNGLENVTYFSSRPEDLESGIIVDPSLLVNLIEIARRCIDLRSGRAIELFTTAGNIAENILASSLAIAERMTTDGSIDDRLIPIITNYLKKRLVELRNEIKTQVERPVFQSLRDAFRPQHSTFIAALEGCAFAPHIVSDAVLATKLKETGLRGHPVVIVSGQAHSVALQRMLKTLYK